jgi:hypothetical protein
MPIKLLLIEFRMFLLRVSQNRARTALLKVQGPHFSPR